MHSWAMAFLGAIDGAFLLRCAALVLSELGTRLGNIDFVLSLSEGDIAT